MAKRGQTKMAFWLVMRHLFATHLFVCIPFVLIAAS
jgi:hypothetical protein